MWRLADRTLDLERPLGVGIVNVTSDSFFSGARSGTPEAAVADGVALAEAGFELLDVGAVAARSGPPVKSKGQKTKAVRWCIKSCLTSAGVAARGFLFHPRPRRTPHLLPLDRRWLRQWR